VRLAVRLAPVTGSLSPSMAKTRAAASVPGLRVLRTSTGGLPAASVPRALRTRAEALTLDRAHFDSRPPARWPGHAAAGGRADQGAPLSWRLLPQRFPAPPFGDGRS
jgi:hypothetical protein